MTNNQLGRLILESVCGQHGEAAKELAQYIVNRIDRNPVAWRTFDGEGGYTYRTYEDNENYQAEYESRNGTRYKGWVEPLFLKD